MIDDELQRQWLDAVPTTLEIGWSVGPRIPEFGNGDVIGVVTPVSGPGPVMEAINTVVGFQIRVVARETDYAALKTSAYQIHKALLFANVPAQLWGGWVTSITTAGGDPAAELGDPTDKDRVAFICTYLAEVEL